MNEAFLMLGEEERGFKMKNLEDVLRLRGQELLHLLLLGIYLMIRG